MTYRKRLATLARALADRLDPLETRMQSGFSENEIINRRLAVWNHPVRLTKKQEKTLLDHRQRVVTKD